MGLILLLLGILLGAYLVFFSLANQQLFSLNILIAGRYLHDIPAWQLVVVCLAIGLGLALIFLIPLQIRAWSKVLSLKNELKRTKALLEEEQLHRPAESLPAIMEPAPKKPEPLPESTEEK
jgi:uncharacterized membrane protein YciS (DUF1049 family)